MQFLKLLNVTISLYRVVKENIFKETVSKKYLRLLKMTLVLVREGSPNLLDKLGWLPKTRTVSLSLSANTTDLHQRLRLCEWWSNYLDTFSRTLICDEATDEINNFHNENVWAFENPHDVREIYFQRRFSVNFWAGIINNEIIGPHFCSTKDRAFLEIYLYYLTTFFYMMVLQPIIKKVSFGLGNL